MQSGRRKYVILALTTLLLAAIPAALGRGNWAHQVISLGVLLWVGAPLIIAAWILAIKQRKNAALYCIAGVGFLAAQLGMGMGALHWDIHRGQRYCESLVPLLDEVYAAELSYPRTLDANGRFPRPAPWAFDTSLINYYSNGETFTFEVSNPAELFGGFIFRHDARHWEEWRD